MAVKRGGGRRSKVEEEKVEDQTDVEETEAEEDDDATEDDDAYEKDEDEGEDEDYDEDDDGEGPSGILKFSKDISKEPKPPTLPAGKYNAEIRKAFVKADKNDAQRIHVQFYIDPDDYPRDFKVDNAPDGTFVTWAQLIYEDTPNGRWRIGQFCAKIDVEASKEVDIDSWVGAGCRVQLRHGTFNGEKTLEVQQVLKA